MLKSASDLGIQFEYPYLNDKKKLKFAITGLKLARYLVTVLGSNIKTVTWMGDNINYNTVFQGGSRGYLSEDVNESAGDYDSMNSAVTIIEKLGPLDANAPYVIEFRKEPAVKDWANFMISCQGIGDDVSITDLEGYASVVPGTVADQSDNNLYTNTTSMTPAYDTSTFPVPEPTQLPDPVSVYNIGSNNTKAKPGSNNIYFYRSDGATARASLHTNNLEAGYYLLTISAVGSSSMTMTPGIVFVGGVAAGHKTINATGLDIMETAGNYKKLYTAQIAIRVSNDIDTETFIASIDFTAGTDSSCYYGCASLSGITQSQYESF